MIAKQSYVISTSMSAWFTPARAMASAADYEQALATLIRTISELLDVQTAGFMLYDPERSELVLQQPAFGIDDPERIARLLGNSIAGLAESGARLLLSGEDDWTPETLGRELGRIAAAAQAAA